MDISDFDFELPEKLIAQHPPEVRGSSRLLVALPTLPIEDKHFGDLPDYVAPGDVLVFNNTKVMKARLFGQKASGGKIEALIERVLDAHTALAHIRSSKSPKPGTELIFEGDIRAVMMERAEELFCLKFEGEQTVYELLEQNGHLPLPPYIERVADDEDDSRYQTVYAKYQGAVAAPTAGLHFTDELLGRLKAKGVETAEVTLHVGAGTFQPVRVDKIEEHKMHSEWFDVPAETVAAVEAAKARGNKVWAVGTTSMRYFHYAGLPLQCCRPLDYQLPPAQINLANARQRVFGHGTYPQRLPSCGGTGIPLFQLWRCDDFGESGINRKRIGAFQTGYLGLSRIQIS